MCALGNRNPDEEGEDDDGFGRLTINCDAPGGVEGLLENDEALGTIFFDLDSGAEDHVGIG